MVNVTSDILFGFDPIHQTHTTACVEAGSRGFYRELYRVCALLREGWGFSFGEVAFSQNKKKKATVRAAEELTEAKSTTEMKLMQCIGLYTCSLIYGLRGCTLAKNDKKCWLFGSALHWSQILYKLSLFFSQCMVAYFNGVRPKILEKWQVVHIALKSDLCAVSLKQLFEWNGKCTAETYNARNKEISQTRH